MKKLLLLTLLFFLVLISFVSAEQISLDGFESGYFCGGSGWTDSCWTASGSTSIIGWSNPYEGNRHVWLRSNNGVLSRTVDISGMSNIEVSFANRVNSFEGGDSAVLEVSIDGGAFTTLHTWTTSNNVWHIETYPVASTGSSMVVRFRSLMSDLGDEIHFDNIQVNGDVGVNSEVSLTMNDNYPVNSDAVITLSSTETDTLHTLQLSHNDIVFCEENVISPSVANTAFDVVCQMPSSAMTDAKAEFFVTNDENINVTDYFNVVSLSSAEDLKITQIYYSPQVLQGGSTEIFAIIENNEPINNLYLTLTYPNGQPRVLSMQPTGNYQEHRAFITDTYLTGNVSFTVSVESDNYMDSYTNYYSVVPYNLDFVNLVNLVSEVLHVRTVDKVMSPTIDVHGTEYVPNDNGRVFIQLLDGNNAPIDDGTCYSSVYYPNNQPFLYKQQMTYVDEGLYFLDFVVPYPNGNYMVSSYCVIDDVDFNEIISYDGFEGGNIIDDFDSDVSTNWIEESPLNVDGISWDVYEGTGSMRVQSGSGSNGKKVTRTFVTPQNYSGATKFSYYLKGGDSNNKWILQFEDTDGNILKSSESTPTGSFVKQNIYVSLMTQPNGTFNFEEVSKVSFVAQYTGSYADNKFDLLQWDDESTWDGDWTLNGAVITSASSYSGDYSLLMANDDDPTRSFIGNENMTSLTVSFYHRTQSMESGEYYYVYVEDASGTDYQLLSVTDGNDDGVWKFLSTTLDAVNDGFDFNGTLRFYIDSSGNTEDDDLLYIDEINIKTSEAVEVNETEYQVVRGSGEVHVSSDYLYSYTLDSGELYYDNFYEGFRQYYTVQSQTFVNTEEVEITLPIYEPFPCDHVLGLQLQNETNTSQWINVTDVRYEYNLQGRNRCYVKFDLDLDFQQDYIIRTDSENYWKQKILGDYQDNLLLNDLMEIACVNYQQSQGYDNYTVPVINQTNITDNLYGSCYGFFNAFYHYEQHLDEHFIPIISSEKNFTTNEMNFLESAFIHLDKVGVELTRYGQTIISGLNLGNSYSQAIINDPYDPVNPIWATYFANISASFVNYADSQVKHSELLNELDSLNVSGGNTSLELPIIAISGTEYAYGQEGMIAVRLSKTTGGGQTLITGATCNTTILYPNTTTFVNSNSMTEYGSGVYYYNFSVPIVEGSYIYSVDCSDGAKNYFSMNTFHVSSFYNSSVDLTTIYDYLQDINTTVTTIDGRVINIEDIVNDTNNRLVLINGTLYEVYDLLLSMNTTINNIYSLANSINANVLEINGTLTSIETVVLDIQGTTTVINSTTVSIDNKVDSLVLSIANINGSLYRVEDKIDEVLFNQIAINTTVNFIDNNVLSLQVTTNNIFDLLSNLSNNFDGFVISVEDSFTELNNTLLFVNQSIFDLHDKIDYLQSDITYLNGSLVTIDYKFDYLNNSLFFMDSKIDYINTSIFYLNGSVDSLHYKVDVVDSNIDDIIVYLSEIDTLLINMNDTIYSIENISVVNYNLLTNLTTNITSLYNLTLLINGSCVTLFDELSLLQELIVNQTNLLEIALSDISYFDDINKSEYIGNESLLTKNIFETQLLKLTIDVFDDPLEGNSYVVYYYVFDSDGLLLTESTSVVSPNGSVETYISTNDIDVNVEEKVYVWSRVEMLNGNGFYQSFPLTFVDSATIVGLTKGTHKQTSLYSVSIQTIYNTYTNDESVGVDIVITNNANYPDEDGLLIYWLEDSDGIVYNEQEETISYLPIGQTAFRRSIDLPDVVDGGWSVHARYESLTEPSVSNSDGFLITGMSIFEKASDRLPILAKRNILLSWLVFLFFVVLLILLAVSLTRRREKEERYAQRKASKT